MPEDKNKRAARNARYRATVAGAAATLLAKERFKTDSKTRTAAKLQAEIDARVAAANARNDYIERMRIYEEQHP